MDASDKHQLEGLLKARSEVLRHGRRPRVRTSATAPVRAASVPVAAVSGAGGPRCEDCGAEIGTRRVRAMPRAERCLHCQRSAEREAAAT